MKKLQRIISIILIMAMIIGLLPRISPVLAVEGESELESGVILRLDSEKGIWTDNAGDHWVVSFDIIVKDIEFTRLNLPIKFDPEKVKPSYVDNGVIKYASSAENFTYNISTELSEDIVATGTLSKTDFSKAEDGEVVLYFYDSKARTFDVQGEKKVCTIDFIIDESIFTLEDITSNVIDVNRNADFYLYNYEEEEFYEDIDTYFALEGVVDVTTVTDISIKTDPTAGKTYTHGDIIDLTGGRILITKENNTVEEISMSDADLIVRTGKQEGAIADINNKTISFTYNGKTVKLNVDVVDPVLKIEFVDEDGILTSEYYQENGFVNNDSIPTEDLYIKAYTKSGEILTIPLDDEDVELSAEEAYIEDEEIGIQTITITYKGQTTEFHILVNDVIDSIAISTTNPPITEYLAGEEFERSGSIKVIGKDNGQVIEEIPIDSDEVTVSDVDLSTPGTKTVTVTYSGKKTTYTINVANVVKAISINKMIETDYEEELTQDSLDGIKVTEIYADDTEGETKDLLIGWMDTSKYNSQSFSRQNIKVSYPSNNGTIVGTAVVKVKNPLNGIRIEDFNTNVKYGDELSFDGAKLYLEYTSREMGPLYIADGMLDDTFNNEEMGPQVVTFTYSDGIYEATTDVTVNVLKSELEVPEVGTLQVAENQAVSAIANQLPTTEYGTVIWKNPRDTVSAGETKAIEAIYKMNDTYKEFYEDVEFTINVEAVEKVVEEIAIKDYPTLEYYSGQMFDGSQLTLEATYEDGTKGELTAGFTIEGIDVTKPLLVEKNQETTKTIQVVYKDFDPIDIELTIKPDEVTGIKLNKSTALVKYGEEIDLSEFKIEPIMISGLQADEIDVTADMVDMDDFDSEVLGDQTIEITYLTFTKEVTITVEDYVKEIELTEETVDKLQKEYEYSEEINLNDENGDPLTINVYYASDMENPTVKNIEDCTITADTKVIGEQTVKVSFGGQEAEFTIEVKDHVKEIKIEEYPKTKVYKVGEVFDPEGLVVRDVMASEENGGEKGKELVIDEDYTVTTTDDLTTPGLKTYTVTKIEDPTLTDEFTILVIEDNDELLMQMYQLPEGKQYFGKELNLTDGSVIVKKDGSDEGTIIPLTDKNIIIEGYDPETKGPQTLKVYYILEYIEEDETDPEDTTDSGDNTGNGDSTDPNDNTENNDNTGNDDNTGDNNNTGNDDTTDPSDNTGDDESNEPEEPEEYNILDHVIKLETEWPIVVYDYKLEELVVTEPEKLEYIYGEELDLTGGEVARIMASGIKFAVSTLTSQMVSGYDPELEGVQAITVTYEGLTKTFNVTVFDNIHSVDLESGPNKTRYNYGEKINIAGAKLKVEKDSGTHIIEITDAMISGYNAQRSGQQTITVNYEGHEVTFNVTVLPKPVPAVSETEEDVKTSPSPTPSEEPTEKPTKTLGEKDENKNGSTQAIIPAVIGLFVTGLLLLLITLLTKKNVEIYVVENGERTLLGKLRINKDTRIISLDEFADDLADKDVQVVLDSKIASKKAGEEIKVKLNSNRTTCKIEAKEDEDFIIEIRK